MIKKLLNYQYDCIRQAIKSSSFNNLLSNKENKIVNIKGDIFKGDNKEIIDIMTRYALNKSTMNLLYADLFLKGEKVFTPLIYCEAELKRQGDKIELIKGENTLNAGIIASLLENDEEKIENIIEQLLDVQTCDFITILKGLINLSDYEIIKQEAIILAKMPESTAGLLNELKIISQNYS